MAAGQFAMNIEVGGIGVRQNIYDNDSFYRSYINLRENAAGLNDVLEIPAFRALLPCLSQMEILDLGCGFGQSCRWYISQGAERVAGDSMTD